MDEDSLEELDRTEASYKKADVSLHAYDGRILEGFVYMPKEVKTEEFLPSKRYMGVLKKGAKQAGLSPEYLDKLAALPVYEASNHPEVMAARIKRREMKDNLPEITNEELWQHKTENPWVRVMGFVVKQNSVFSSHKGRDVNSRMLMQFHGIPLDDNDDGGAPPYLLLQSLSEEEIEYLTSWLDHYHLGPMKGLQEENAQILGFLKEFKEQQDSTETDFVLPPIPQ